MCAAPASFVPDNSQRRCDGSALLPPRNVVTGLIAALLCGLAVGSQPAEPARDQLPLSAIAGVEPPAPVATQPLADFPDIQAACDKARAQIEDGRFREALDNLTTVASQPGGDRCEVHYLLALAYTGAGQLDAARQSAETAARLGHGQADVHYLLGQLYHRQGDLPRAIAQYRTATLAAPRELSNVHVTLAWYGLGTALAQAGYRLAAAEALAGFDSAVWQTHPEQRNAAEITALLAANPHGMVPVRLELLQGLGRTREALAVAQWAREIWPDAVPVARWYAQALLAADEAAAALEFCERWPPDEAAAVALLTTTVDAARAAGRLDGWLDRIVAAVNTGSRLEVAQALLRRLPRLEEARRAVRVGEALRARRPERIGIASDLAAAQQAAGDLKGALATLITFVRANPALAVWPQEQLEEWRRWVAPGTDVAQLADELRRQVGADFATDFVLGVSALAAGQSALGDELLQACRAARPEFAPACVAQAQLALAEYRWDDARALAEKLIAEHPDLPAAQLVLAAAYDGLDADEQAQAAYKQAIRLAPHEPACKLALARHYRRIGDLLGAPRYFQAVLADDPGNGEALEGLIDCYVRAEKIEMARAQFERIDPQTVPPDSLRRIRTTMRFLDAPFGPAHLAELKAQLEEHPDDLTTAQLLAASLSLRGRPAEALEVIRAARRFYPDDYHLMFLQAQVQAAGGEAAAALDLLETLAQRYPNRLAVLEPLALHYLDDFDFQRGRALLERALAGTDDPDRRQAYREKLRESYLVFGQYDEALRLVESWIALQPKEDELLLQKAIVLILAQRGPEALATLEEYLARNPNDAEHRARYARLAPATRQYEPLLQRLRTWVEQEPTDALATERLIDALLAADRPDEALEVARRFEGSYAESFQRRLWLGRCQAARGNVDAALAEFDELLNERRLQEAQRLDGWGKIIVDTWQQIVTTLVQADRVDEALQRCEQWLDQAEGPRALLRPAALHFKRQLLQVAGKERESAAVMEALLPHAPQVGILVGEPGYVAGLCNDLGYVWADQGMHLEQATALIRRALEAEPWNAAFIDSLGWACYKAGDFENARKHLTRATQLRDGQDPVVYDHLGDALYRLGEPDAAHQAWQKALALAEQETDERVRARLAELVTTVRAKLAAAASGQSPPLAPTAAEQQPAQQEATGP